MLRMIKIALAMCVGLWCMLGAFGNLTDWQGTVGAVRAAISMSTFEGGADSWRAIDSGVVALLGAIFIVTFKLMAGALALVGTAQMWFARHANSATFSKSQELVLAGIGVAVFMLFFGWIIVAETWFELWRSDVLRDMSLQSALRYGLFLIGIGLFISTKEA